LEVKSGGRWTETKVERRSTVLARWTCWFEAILGAVMGGEGWCGEMDGERGSEGAIGLRSHEDVVAHGRDETEAGCQGREDGAEVEIVYGLWMCIVIEIPDPARNNVDGIKCETTERPSTSQRNKSVGYSISPSSFAFNPSTARAHLDIAKSECEQSGSCSSCESYDHPYAAFRFGFVLVLLVRTGMLPPRVGRCSHLAGSGAAGLSD
jgi:hypothetical protein